MIYWTVIGTLIAGLGGLLVYVYYLRKGQFDDLEDVKYDLFRNDDRMPGPDHKK